MNILEIIARKRDKQVLTAQEISYFVREYTKGSITDYQAAALVMAIYINGMQEEEITNLTLSMAHSGDVLDLSKLGTVVDKHSTGGVGDKVTLILMPIVASLGVTVAKMSGRGLGYTGGTIDKLEAIPGYQTNIAEEEFIQNVEQIGISLIGQTLNLAPADKKLYALRDTISCTESIALIASSIMSKKIAAGAGKIVLDITCGSGAFMKKEEEALLLAKTMQSIGRLAGKETVCVLTHMDQPLGKAVGNTLELIEAVEALKGKMEKDVEEVVLTLGSYMLKLAGKGEDREENKKCMLQNIHNTKAYAKFLELVKNQGGDISYLNDTEKLEKASFVTPIASQKEGYIKRVDAQRIGKFACDLGAGRVKKEDSIDPRVGILLEKKVGSYVKVGEILAKVYSSKELTKEQVEEIWTAYEIVQEVLSKPKTILKIVE